MPYNFVNTVNVYEVKIALCPNNHKYTNRFVTLIQLNYVGARIATIGK